ncbi:MAG: universal stress protein [Alphaproteobacteria bacterium]|jgi:nucleotide-binding universal stress UspA family protein|nr:universal stress protein [Alphaproteobacteria bacterium]MBT8475232.1 universal stress protein [Alphaproteobacteria bacterium]NNF70644.1 universal stress protein [Paracoccaceae bacterium]
MYKKILVATDGSELANHAVEHGIGLASATGAEVVFVSVTEIWSALEIAGQYEAGDLSAIPDYEAAAASSAAKILTDCAARAEKANVASKTVHVPDRRPADGIMETADKEDCDLIVMATHGRRGVRKMLIGSQTAEVLALGTRPVLVLR